MLVLVKFLGGAKKIFNASELCLEQDNLTIGKLVEHLIHSQPNGNADFNGKNILVAVNGVDSSVLDGSETILKPDDVVSIIPVIHGGTKKRIIFEFEKTFCEVFFISKIPNDIDFLNDLREKFPQLTLQAIDKKFILSENHIQKIISISLHAKKLEIMLSKKLEVDILLRFAGTSQISQAILYAGRKPQNDFFIIGIGSKSRLDKLYVELNQLLSKDKFPENSRFLQKFFGLTLKHIDSISSKNPLEDLLVERAAIL